MSLAYSFIWSEYSCLTEFTAAHLCPNAYKKHSQSHRCSCYMHSWAQKAPSIPLFLLSQYPQVIGGGHSWNKKWYHQEPIGVSSNTWVTKRVPLLIFWQPPYYTALCSLPVGDILYPIPANLQTTSRNMSSHHPCIRKCRSLLSPEWGKMSVS